MILSCTLFQHVRVSIKVKRNPLDMKCGAGHLCYLDTAGCICKKLLHTRIQLLLGYSGRGVRISGWVLHTPPPILIIPLQSLGTPQNPDIPPKNNGFLLMLLWGKTRGKMHEPIFSQNHLTRMIRAVMHSVKAKRIAPYSIWNMQWVYPKSPL